MPSKILVHIALALAFTTCKTMDQNASELKWGHVEHIRSFNYLIKIPPPQTEGQTVIPICGTYASEAAESAAVWANLIGRGKYIKFEASKTCSGNPWAITVLGPDDPGHDCSTKQLKIKEYFRQNIEEDLKNNRISRQEAQIELTKLKREIVSPASFYIKLRTIEFCDDQIYSHNPDFRKRIFIHEMGHAWGLCDQYVKSNNCSPVHTLKDAEGQPVKVRDSIMGSNYALTPSQDDIDGITQLANRSDLKENASWQRFLNGAREEKRETKEKSEDNLSTPLLDCNKDYSKIRQGGTGVCVNATSGRNLCYHFRNKDVVYSQTIACPSSSQPDLNEKNPKNEDKNDPSKEENPRSKTDLLDCNRDFSKIRSGISGICINATSGSPRCYHYSGGIVQYDKGNIARP